MKAIQQIIRILVIIILADHARCQDGYDNRDILRYQHMATNEGDAVAYGTNILHRERDNQPVRTPNIHLQTTDEINKNEYHRADRTRKVYRIKNPFQQDVEDNKPQNEGNSASPDVGTAASNQYASMQYSLPPEEFLQQMRAESQYYQQQQTTPSPNMGYTATPQPQYQYSTIPSGSYDNTNQQSIPQIESKSQSQYLNNNAYQFNPANTFHFDSVQSTPPPATTYLSTAHPNNQYVSTSNSYVSSSSPLYLSSPSNIQYVSSPISAVQTGTPDYNINRVTTTIGSNSLSYNDNNDQFKKIQIDHYDNSANGIRYPVNPAQQQYSSDYGSSTSLPPLDSRETWQSNSNNGVNALSKSLQEISVTQFQNYPYNNNNPQDSNRPDSNLDGNSGTHRIGNIASANNIYLNYAQPEIQGYGNGKSRTRDTERDIGQPEYYSNGDYGWKLGGRKQMDTDVYAGGNLGNYPRYHANVPDNGAAVSQMTFHMDTSRSSNYDQTPKSSVESSVAQDFAKAAANAHEYMKQQQSYYGNNYANSYSTNPISAPYNSNSYYSTDKEKTKYIDASTSSPYSFNSQSDMITSSSPFYYNSRENNIDKQKQPFDHAKALKAIVPIDVSNVVPNSEAQSKDNVDNNSFNLQNYAKSQINQNQQQIQFRPITDSYYKDKNSYYSLNIKTKPDEYVPDNLKQYEPSSQYFPKPPQSQESVYNQGIFGSSGQQQQQQQRITYNPPLNYPENVQSSPNQPRVNVQPDSINSILKLNDIPYQLTQALSPDSFRFQNSEYDHGNLPTSLPVRINQDVSSHQLEVTSNILNKLLSNKPPFNGRPEMEPQTGNGLSLINGFKVANPFNMDLKVVAEMLKGKSPDNTNVINLRDQYNNKPTPLKFDLSQLQFLLKNDNVGNLVPINDGLAGLNSPFLEIYNSGRYPYQGMKYSRSQEEEEDTIVPIADSSHTHPIGAVSEQDDSSHVRETTGESDLTGQDDEGVITLDKDLPKKPFHPGHKMVKERHRHTNSILGGRYQKKYPISEVDEPYPLLKPPPPHLPRTRGSSHFKMEKHGRKRRVNKPRVYRVLKTEPLFESDNEGDSLPTVLRPRTLVAEEKSDSVVNIEETT